MVSNGPRYKRLRMPAFTGTFSRTDLGNQQHPLVVSKVTLNAFKWLFESPRFLAYSGTQRISNSIQLVRAPIPSTNPCAHSLTAEVHGMLPWSSAKVPITLYSCICWKLDPYTWILACVDGELGSFLKPIVSATIRRTQSLNLLVTSSTEQTLEISACSSGMSWLLLQIHLMSIASQPVLLKAVIAGPRAQEGTWLKSCANTEVLRERRRILKRPFWNCILKFIGLVLM